MMKVFKRFSAAKNAANGKPLIRVGAGKGAIYILVDGDLVNTKLTEAAIINSNNGEINGHVTMGHLARLGNANWAEATRPYSGENVFKNKDAI